jgi:hypothetical protein
MREKSINLGKRTKKKKASNILPKLFMSPGSVAIYVAIKRFEGFSDHGNKQDSVFFGTLTFGLRDRRLNRQEWSKMHSFYF